MPFSELPADNDDPDVRVVISEQDAREAARLLRLISEAVGHRPDADLDGHVSPELLTSRARIIFHSRKARVRFFNRAMFGEPAWDILLALYINDVGGSRLTASKIAEWIEQPFSTVVRWIDYLEKERLIERMPHPNDKRILIIRLLGKGRRAMEGYLGTTPVPVGEA